MQTETLCLCSDSPADSLNLPIKWIPCIPSQRRKRFQVTERVEKIRRGFGGGSRAREAREREGREEEEGEAAKRRTNEIRRKYERADGCGGASVVPMST